MNKKWLAVGGWRLVEPRGMIRSVSVFILAAVTLSGALAGSSDGPTLSDRARNPWFISVGSFATGSELGTAFQNSNYQNYYCGSTLMNPPDIALFQSLGLEVGAGFDLALQPVDLRFSTRVQTFGPTNNQVQGNTHSIFGFDALFRSNQLYFGPGVGIGYVSARTSGLTFQGVPTQVLSAVVGYDASQSTFAEARLQTAPASAYKVASVSFGLRF
jgi:hypothetical protein